MSEHLGRILHNVAAFREKQQLTAMISQPISAIGHFAIPADDFWPPEECGEYKEAKLQAGLEKIAPVGGIAFTLNHLFLMPAVKPQDNEQLSRFHRYLNAKHYNNLLDEIVADLRNMGVPALMIIHGEREDNFYQHAVFVPRTKIQYRDAEQKIPYEEHDVLIMPTVLMYLLQKGILSAGNEEHLRLMKAAAPIRAVALALDMPGVVRDPDFDEIRQRIQTEIKPLELQECDKFPNWLTPLERLMNERRARQERDASEQPDNQGPG